jgi:RNA recognition motif-containing protein
MPQVVDEAARLFVGSIKYDVTKAELTAFFAKVGPVKDVYMAMDRQRGNGLNRGFAFVQMEYAVDALRAIELFNGKNGPGGRRLGIKLANHS